MGLENVNKAHRAFLDKLLQSIRVMNNLKEVIPMLNEYRKAIFSEDTAELTMPKLKKLGLENIFDVVLTSDKIGLMKPSEKYYRKIFRKFGLEPDECLVIGDDYEKDLSIPKDMGATTVIYGKKDKRAHYHIDDHSQLPDILKRI